ncbi:MAG: dockerin type I repeat-containing protein [Oscillospiraceae bacterium]|nr:dockerin type I repeat-containing protein [Oscillospiraceae bacterium]
MKCRNVIAAAAALCLAGGTVCFPLPSGESMAVRVSATDPACRDIDPLQYTYEIYPLVEPFNEYFYVKTDNPNPESFRFADHDSPYSETSVIEAVDAVYADVEYEDDSVRRVNGGYLFKSFSTNGGKVTLQVQESITKAEFNTEIYGTPEPESTGYSPYHGMPVGSYNQYHDGGWSYSILGYYRWTDSDITFTLPALCDDCDYLIEQYAKGEDFFTDMDAVQSGFSSICLYSGSYIRGELYRSGNRDWHLTPGAHVDQSFYIYSPYSRKDNKSLLASALYPYRYDSLGFPGMMGKVSSILSDRSSYEWSSTSHAYINVTYDGVTKSYGGAGHGEGQGISADKLTHIFTFGDNDESMTLEASRALLDEYAAVEMDDDIPREDQLTWGKIYDTVGDGAWVDMGGYYTYLYQRDDRASFSSDEWGVGNKLYWGGSLGYCWDTWVDGRYISKIFVEGETFEDHPESAVLLTTATVPVITECKKSWDQSASGYVYTSAEVEETEQKNVTFRYDAEEQNWKANVNWGGSDNSYKAFRQLTEQGLIDEKYLAMLTLSREDVEAIIASGNTDRSPESGYLYDGYAPQGAPFRKGDLNNDGSCDVLDVVLLQQWILAVPKADIANQNTADMNDDKVLDVFDLSLLKRQILHA